MDYTKGWRRFLPTLEVDIPNRIIFYCACICKGPRIKIMKRASRADNSLKIDSLAHYYNSL